MENILPLLKKLLNNGGLTKYELGICENKEGKIIYTVTLYFQNSFGTKLFASTLIELKEKIEKVIGGEKWL